VGLAIEDGIFYGHLVYFKAIWFILRPFCIFYGHLVYFSRFGMLHQKNLATLPLPISKTISSFPFGNIFLSELSNCHD
jgi:hypothetical protein